MSFKNLSVFTSRLRRRGTVKAQRHAVRAVTKAVMLVSNDAKSSIAEGGSGEVVARYNPRRTHTQSKAGQPPATDTGFLISQITTEVNTKMGGAVVGKVISAAPYSQALEYGTTNMQARPFLHPALRRNQGKIRAIFLKEGIIG